MVKIHFLQKVLQKWGVQTQKWNFPLFFEPFPKRQSLYGDYPLLIVKKLFYFKKQKYLPLKLHIRAFCTQALGMIKNPNSPSSPMITDLSFNFLWASVLLVLKSSLTQLTFISLEHLAKICLFIYRGLGIKKTLSFLSLCNYKFNRLPLSFQLQSARKKRVTLIPNPM